MSSIASSEDGRDVPWQINRGVDNYIKRHSALVLSLVEVVRFAKVTISRRTHISPVTFYEIQRQDRSVEEAYPECQYFEAAMVLSN